MNDSIGLDPITPQDRDWIRDLLRERWSAVEVVSRGKIYSADRLPGFIARERGAPVGLITYSIKGDQCEIVTIDSLTNGRGIGSALITRVRQEAIAGGCRRLWLITTNDNLSALGFYQKRGFKLVALYPNAIEVSRRLKPSIPRIGQAGIPIRDELELEMSLP